MIKIVSKVDGFWRAGVQHVGTVEYKESDFTPEQWAELEAEPNLIVIKPGKVTEPGKVTTSQAKKEK